MAKSDVQSLDTMSENSDVKVRIVPAPRNNNGDSALVGRISVSELVRTAEPRKIGENLTTELIGATIATRVVFLDGLRIGQAEQFQRLGKRRDRGGYTVESGRGHPVMWLFVADDGPTYGEYAHRLLSVTLFESVTVYLGGSI